MRLAAAARSRRFVAGVALPLASGGLVAVGETGMISYQPISEQLWSTFDEQFEIWNQRAARACE
jgi:hypothetical protein